MNTTTRFDLEQDIMNAWNVVTDLADLNAALLNGELTVDQVSNILMGMKELYQIKFDKLFSTFEDIIDQNEW